MDPMNNPDVLARNHGISPIGAAQRTIAFTAVAAGPVYKGRATLLITAAAHALKKGTCVYIASGTYAGVWRIAEVVSSSVIKIYCDVAFVATASGNLLLTAHLDGFGFYCDEVPLTIAEFTPESSNIDSATIIATVFIAGVWYPYPMKKIRLTAGNITVVRKPIPALVSYSNR